MESGRSDFTGYSESSQERPENDEKLAIEFARIIKWVEEKLPQRHTPANRRTIDQSDEEIELQELASASSPTPLSEAFKEMFAPENSRATFLAAANYPDVWPWTMLRLWDVYSNVIANGTNSDASNPNSSYSKFLNATHTGPGINPIDGAIAGAGAIAVLVGLAQRAYQLHRLKELNTPAYMIRRLDEMRNKYKDSFKLNEDEVKAYQYTPDDILNLMNEILKRDSFNYQTSQSDVLSPYEDYFEASAFVKNFNKFTETKPIQFLGEAWEFLEVQSLWFWVVWFPAYFIAGAALAAAMPYVLIVTGVIGGLHLVHKLSAFIHKKITGIDDAEVAKEAETEAEAQLVVNKLKIKLAMEADHKMFMDMMRKKHDADVGTYDFCVVASDETTFLDDIENDESSSFLHRLRRYLDSSFKPIESLAESELPDEKVRIGKLYLQKVELKNKNGVSESCIAYVVKNPKGKVKSGVIPHDEINPPEPFTHSNLNLIKNQVLDYIARQGHILDLNHKIDLTKELNDLYPNNLPRVSQSDFEIDLNNQNMITLKKTDNPNQPEKPAPCAHIYDDPDTIFDSDLAKHLLGSETERKARLYVSTAHKFAMGFIFTSFMLWFAASIAGVVSAAASVLNVLSMGAVTNSIAAGIGSFLGLNVYCKVKAEQAAYKKKVYEKLTEVVSPGVTRLDRFTYLEKKVEEKKAKVIELRNRITGLKLQKNNAKKLNEDDEKSLVPELDVSKIDVYNNYYFEKQKEKPSLKTMVKKGLNRVDQVFRGGQTGILIVRLTCLVGGIAVGILTGTIIPFLIFAGVSALVVGGLQLAKYQLNRNQEHRENFVNTLEERTNWLATKEKELDVVINQLERNQAAAEVALAPEPAIKQKKRRKIADLVEKVMDDVPEANCAQAVKEVKKEQAQIVLPEKKSALTETSVSSSYCSFYNIQNDKQNMIQKSKPDAQPSQPASPGIETSQDLSPIFSC